MRARPGQSSKGGLHTAAQVHAKDKKADPAMTQDTRTMGSANNNYRQQLSPHKYSTVPLLSPHTMVPCPNWRAVRRTFGVKPAWCCDCGQVELGPRFWPALRRQVHHCWCSIRSPGQKNPQLACDGLGLGSGLLWPSGVDGSSGWGFAGRGWFSVSPSVHISTRGTVHYSML